MEGLIGRKLLTVVWHGAAAMNSMTDRGVGLPRGAMSLFSVFSGLISWAGGYQ